MLTAESLRQNGKKQRGLNLNENICHGSTTQTLMGIYIDEENNLVNNCYINIINNPKSVCHKVWTHSCLEV